METKIKLWMPITKDSNTGKYHAVLSDDSLDRDEEIVGKELILNWAKNSTLPALANHENSMEKWVGGWNNIKAVEKDNRNALTAEPWFFSKEANPLASQIEKQIEEAIKNNLNPGISIGAIVHDSRMEKINGKDTRVFTKGELLEATWVPIQSNRNANYGHVAKQFGLNKEENIMSDIKFTQKDIDSAIEKKAEELNKQLVEKDTEISNLNKKIKVLEKECDDKDKDKEESEKKSLELSKELEKAKKVALEKQKYAGEGQNAEEEAKKLEEEKKAFASGKIPVMRF